MANEFNLEQARHQIAADAWASLNGDDNATQAFLKDLRSLTVDQRLSVARSLSDMGIGSSFFNDFEDQTASAGTRWLRISSNQNSQIGSTSEPNVQFEIGTERQDNAAYKTIFVNDLRDPKLFPTEQVGETIKQLSTKAINGDQAAISGLVQQLKSLTPAELRVVNSELHHNGSLVAPYFFPQFDGPALNQEQRAGNFFSSVANIRDGNDRLYFWKEAKLLVVRRNGSETVTSDELKNTADEIALTASRAFNPKSGLEKQEALGKLTKMIQDGFRKSPFQMDLALKAVAYESRENKALQQNPGRYTIGPDGPTARLAKDGKSVELTLTRGENQITHVMVSDVLNVPLSN